MNSMVQRVDEMRDTFQYGKKMLSFFDELFHIYQDIVPFLDKINQSIEESSSKLPRASSELSKVTQATEVATIEILNTIEEMNHLIGESTQLIKNVREVRESRNNLYREIVKMCDSLKMHDNAESVERVKTLLRQYVSNKSGEQVIEKVAGNISKLSDFAGDITISLQVQDITAQQLAAVNQLVESVHTRLYDLLQSLDENNVAPSAEMFSGKDKSFDPAATYFHSGERQKLADALQNSQAQKTQNGYDRTSHHNRTSQEEIDRLFKKTDK